MPKKSPKSQAKAYRIVMWERDHEPLVRPGRNPVRRLEYFRMPVHCGAGRDQIRKIWEQRDDPAPDRRVNETIGCFDLMLQRTSVASWLLRGWVLDRYGLPAGYGVLAEEFGYTNPEDFAQILSVLEDMNWIKRVRFRRNRQPSGSQPPPNDRLNEYRNEKETKRKLSKRARAGKPSDSDFGGQEPSPEAKLFTLAGRLRITG